MLKVGYQADNDLNLKGDYNIPPYPYVNECKTFDELINSARYKNALGVVLGLAKGFNKSYVIDLFDKISNSKIIVSAEKRFLLEFLKFENIKRLSDSLIKKISTQGDKQLMYDLNTRFFWDHSTSTANSDKLFSYLQELIINYPLVDDDRVEGSEFKIGNFDYYLRSKGEKKSIVKKGTNELIEIKNSEFQNIEIVQLTGNIIVYDNGKFGLFNISNDKLITMLPVEYAHIQYLSKYLNNNNRSLTKTNTHILANKTTTSMGLYLIEGTVASEVLPCSYSYIGDIFGDGYCIVGKNNRFGIIKVENKTYKDIVPLQLDINLLDMVTYSIEEGENGDLFIKFYDRSGGVGSDYKFGVYKISNGVLTCVVKPKHDTLDLVKNDKGQLVAKTDAIFFGKEIKLK